MATPQKSRAAILSGAKAVVARVGSYESLMNDIAERSEVSRATIYNHFVDRDELMSALVAHEVDALIALGKAATSKAEALYVISRAISDDEALAKMIEADQSDIVVLTTITGHPVWVLIHQELAAIFGANENTVGLVLRWLVAQVTSPLTEPQSRVQAERLATLL